MKLNFEPNLEYQQEAIGAVVGLFEGQSLENSDYRYSMRQDGEFDFIDGVGNRLTLSDEQILANLQRVQEQNAVAVSESLDGMHFSIEMETGTGKTYVYLRTIYELNQKYGFKKFVIVVPSVPIREGVLKNLEITKDHFHTLYNNTPCNYYIYMTANALLNCAASRRTTILKS